jgi:hypothetical protein
MEEVNMPKISLPAILLSVLLVGVPIVLIPSPSAERAIGDAQNPIGRLQALQPGSARTRILVLGTFHLRKIQDAFKPAWLDRLVAVLEGFKPDAIGVETLPGARVREIELRRGAGSIYDDLLKSFAARHLKLGKQAVDLLRTTPEAALKKVSEIQRAARSGPKPGTMTADARANLVLWMLAAYDPESAVLQWSGLSDQEKRDQKTIPPDLGGQLDGDAIKVNEVPALAARLARISNLEKLEPVDDFEDLDAYGGIDAQIEKDFAQNPLLTAVGKASIYKESDARLEECVRNGDLLPQYVFLNSPEFMAADVEAQWGVFLRTHLPSGVDRSRLGLWENRNLKIAARIRAVAALHPGGRILVIYGAAHKPFLEAYLSQMADVELVRFEDLEIRAGATRK